MYGYGQHGHLLFATLAGIVWVVLVAGAFAILFFVIRFAVLSALKAHTTWAQGRVAPTAPAAPIAAPAPPAVSAEQAAAAQADPGKPAAP